MDGPSNTTTLLAEPEGPLAARLIELARAAPAGLLFVAPSETRAERLHRSVVALEPGLPVLLLPGWDCLPYDRIGPSRRAMGLRLDAVHRIAEHVGGPLLVIAGAEAAMQRLPASRLAVNRPRHRRGDRPRRGDAYSPPTRLCA